MKKELNINNSKKLIIGISILFCTVILIIGGTIAYFTQSGIGDTGNIVSTDQVTLDYEDNDDYMLGELIPIDEQHLVTAYNNKCKDEKGYNVCSIYQFTITNTGDISQDIIIDLFPKKNEFTNLEFNLYDITTNEQIIFNQELTLNSDESITLENDLTLDTSNNKSNTYELVFYIENDKYNDQTILDAGKVFTANIKVNSVTTGTYLIENVGNEEEDCWIFDEIDTTKVNTFNGFDEEGNVKTHCEEYFNDEDEDEDTYYTVNIPTSYAGQPIITLGNKLFNAVELTIVDGNPVFNVNKYSKINNIKISDDIKFIENGDLTSYIGTFLGVGFKEYGESGMIFYDEELSVTFPDTLEVIGDGAFMFTNLNNVKISKNIETIGWAAFSGSKNLTTLTFEEGSQLKTIGDSAFSDCNITTGKDNPLIIPYSVQTIGDSAFNSNYNLTKLEFAGSLTDVFDDENNENYNLLTIGESAFYGDGLDYSEDEELVLPARINSIGKLVFSGNPDDPILTSLKNIRYMGNASRMNLLDTDWYPWGVTIKDIDGNVYTK